MARLYRLALGCIGVLALLMLVGRLVGSTRPLPLAILFTNPDGSTCQRPCLFGIRPGETTFDQAFALLREHPFIRQAAPREYRDMGLFGGGPIVVSITPDAGGKVGQVNIELDTKVLKIKPEPLLGRDSLIELSAILGTPVTVEASTVMFCFYPADGIVLAVNKLQAQRVGQDDTIAYISLQTHERFTRHLEQGDFRLSAWRGFSDMRRYVTPTAIP